MENDLETSVIQLIQEHLPSKDKEKSEHGEVFTPPSMIDNLFDHYPPSVWKQKDRTWLDPATGIGNFCIVLFFRLMIGLASAIPNKVKRATHIIENMIFMAEINTDNIKICKKIFKKLCPTASPNLHAGDFLSLEPNKIGWPDTFDSVIGNPPYNIGGTGLEGSKRTHIVFTERGLQLLSPSGYIGYICPPSYREADTPMND